MKKKSVRIILAGALLFYCGLFIYTVVCADVVQNDRQSGDRNLVYIRVLIDEKERSKLVLAKSFWSFSSQNSFIVSDFKNPDRRQKLEVKNISVGMARDGHMMINGRRLLSDYIKIESAGGPIKWGKYTYNGSFFVIKRKDTFFLVNYVELEDYVAAGLRWEMVPGWPAATLEAGAIAYRTYVIDILRQKQLMRKKKYTGYDGDEDSDDICDIGSTWMHQVYRGIHASRSVHDAVEKTRGLIITSNRKPVSAMYHACCGGSIPAKRAHIDFIKHPYLARSYSCAYCKKFKYFSWKYSCSLAKLSQRLSSVISKNVSGEKNSQKALITDIVINKKDTAGVVQELLIKAGKHRFIVSTGTLTRLIGEIKSGTFVIVKKGKHVSFEGKGFGHQLGFCQWGAYGMGLKGRSCREILHFYYPKTVILNRKEIK